MARDIVGGADVGAVVDAVQQFVDAGAQRIHFHQVGPEQERFIRAFADDLRPRL